MLATSQATVNPTISNTSFTAAHNDLLDLTVGGEASAKLTMNTASPNNDRFSNSNTNIVSGGGGVVLSAGGPSSAKANLEYDIENATFEGALGNAVSIGSATGNNTVTGKFLNNTIGVSGTVGSGSKQGSDLSIAGIQHGTITTAVEGNKFYHYNNDGLALSTANEESSGSPFMTLNATVKNNTIAQPDTEAIDGVEVIAGVGETGSATKMCLNIAGNTLTGSHGGGSDVYMEIPETGNDSILLQGYEGSADNSTEVGNFIKGANTVGTVEAFNHLGTIAKASSNCQTPP